MPATTKLSQKYQIVIPKTAREQMSLKEGMRVMVYPVNDKYALLMRDSNDRVAALKGLGKEVWKSLGGGIKYIKQERASWHKK